MFFDLTQQYVTNTVRQALADHRAALARVENAYNFLNGFSVADLQVLGFTQPDAQDLKTAAADAHEEVVLHNGGGLGSYTLPYPFSAAQNRVCGP